MGGTANILFFYETPDDGGHSEHIKGMMHDVLKTSSCLLALLERAVSAGLFEMKHCLLGTDRPDRGWHTPMVKHIFCIERKHSQE